MSEVYAEEFKSLVEKAKAVSKPIRVALAGADSENMLKAIFDAEADGFVKPILIGNYEKIHAILKRLGLADREYDLQPINDDTNAVQYAIEMINAGKANCLMRGNTQTKDFLLPVLNRMNHLIREGALVTHVTFLKAPEQEKICAYSDVTLLVKPSVEQRKQVVRNMVRALGVFDLHNPKIALLDLVETPSFNLRNSIENQGIVIEHRKRPIADVRQPADQGSPAQLSCNRIRHPGRSKGSNRHQLPKRRSRAVLSVSGSLRCYEEQQGSGLLRVISIQ